MKINFNTKKQNNPERDQEMKVNYAPAKRKVAKLRWYVILLLVVSPLLYLFWQMIYQVVVVNAPGFVSLEKTIVNASISGVVDRVRVRPGDIVEAGDSIVLLQDPRLDEREKILIAELNSLNTPLPPTGSGVETLLRDRIELAEQMVRHQEEKLEKMRYLQVQGAATIADLNHAVDQYNTARFTYNEAQSQLSERLEVLQKAALQPVSHLELRSERIDIELAAIQEQREKLTHRSNTKARVLDIFIKEGMVISPGTNMLLLGELQDATITAYLSPKKAKYSRAGQMVTIELPDGRTLSALVKHDSGLTKRLPADLASPIGSRDLMIVVQIEPVEPIPTELMIDGLPVSIRFHSFDFLNRLATGK